MGPAAVVVAAQKYLDRVILHGPITLDKLMQIEHKLNADYQLQYFSTLDHSTFLEFILNQPDIKKVKSHSCCSCYRDAATVALGSGLV